MEFHADDVSDYELMDDGRLFVSAEEMQLLNHAMDRTPYEPVSVRLHVCQPAKPQKEEKNPQNEVVKSIGRRGYKNCPVKPNSEKSDHTDSVMRLLIEGESLKQFCAGM